MAAGARTTGFLGATLLSLALGQGAALAQATEGSDGAPQVPQMSVPEMPTAPGSADEASPSVTGSETGSETGSDTPAADATDGAASRSGAAPAPADQPQTAPATESQGTPEAPAPATEAATQTPPAATTGEEQEAGAASDPSEPPVEAPAAGTAETATAAEGEAPAAETGPAQETDTAGTEAEVIPPAPAARPPETAQAMLASAAQRAVDFLRTGGPAIWAIAALSVVTLALILWKIWRLVQIGAWSRRHARRAVTRWEAGDYEAAFQSIKHRRGMRSSLTKAAMRARLTLPEPQAREETARVAKSVLARSQGGLRALELISTIAPLLGLLGTVMGMISAFQALQEAGNRADPAMLAGGIWEALLTTAAGMAVAIPASAALTWFEAVIGNVRQDMEDLAARIFIARDTAGGEAGTEGEDARMDVAAQ